MLMAVLFVAACNPVEDASYALGDMSPVKAEDISFTITPSAKSPNIVTLTNTTPRKGVISAVWTVDVKGDLQTFFKDKIELTLPEAGDYPVMLTIYNPDGTAVSKNSILKIANSDFSLVSSEAYVNLTGGVDKPAGKVWVFDQYNNFAKEVADATGKNVKGHLGLGPQGSIGQEWWGAGPNEKGSWKMYDFKFNFIQAGVKLNITNGGEGYGRKASSANVGGFTVTGENGDDVFFPYNGGAYTFSIDETGANPILKLSGNAFMGYYCGSQEYEVFYQTDKVMALRVNNTVESQDWVFVYCLEELNVPPAAVVKEPKVVPLSEDFEGATPKVILTHDAMGDKSAVVDNPLPVPLNTSNKVYRYQKTGEFYSNMRFTAADYKFDLTKQNKIKIKVFIPSYNDYTTDHATAGSWISNAKLQPQLAIKLQNSEHPAPWETQTEIVKADLVKDKWIELTYDFSGVASRTDYDRIVIQFGAEGHAGPGFFFFDDFSFGE